MTETALRNEITRRAPHLKIVTVGLLFGGQTIDAIVADSRGQYLWSVYAGILAPQPIESIDLAPAPLGGQKRLF